MPRTGRSNWVYETGNYINGSPAVADGQTAFGGCDGLLHVVSLADGKQVRSVDAGAYIAASAALADGCAYFGQYENEFLCAELKEGKKVWTFHDRDFPYFSSPAVTKDRVLFGGRDKLLHCVNRADGKPVWSFRHARQGGQLAGGLRRTGSSSARMTGGCMWSRWTKAGSFGRMKSASRSPVRRQWPIGKSSSARTMAACIVSAKNNEDSNDEKTLRSVDGFRVVLARGRSVQT